MVDVAQISDLNSWASYGVLLLLTKVTQADTTKENENTF